MIEINNYRDLENLTERVINDPAKISLSDIEWNIPSFESHFKDGDSKGCIDGELIAILNRTQKRIYKDFGLLLFGKSSISKLTKEEKNLLKIRIAVREGSNKNIFDLSSFFEKLAEMMKPEDIPKTVKFITIACCITFVFTKSCNAYLNYRIKEREIIREEKTLAEYSRLSSSYLDYLANMQDVTLNGEKLSREDLIIAKRENSMLANSIDSKREPGDCIRINGMFKVVEFKNDPEYSVTIADAETGTTYKPKLGNEPSPNMDKLALYAANKDRVAKMEIAVVLDSKGSQMETRIIKLDDEPFIKDLFSEL